MTEQQMPITSPQTPVRIGISHEPDHPVESHQRMRAGECLISGIAFLYPFAVVLQNSKNKLPLFCPHGHQFVPVKTEIIGVEADRIQLLSKLLDSRHRNGGPEMKGFQSDLSALSRTAPLALEIRRPPRGVAIARRLRIFQRSTKSNFGEGRSVIAGSNPRGLASNVMDFNRDCAALVLVNARRRLRIPMDGSMSQDRFTRPRRRRGGKWTLYRVERESGPVGFVVLDDRNLPHPRCFVQGVTPASLRLAVRIDRGGAITEPAVDLRKVPWSKLPAEIAGTRRLDPNAYEYWPRPFAFISGSMLIPIDCYGRKSVGRTEAAILEMKHHGASEDGMLCFLDEIPPWDEQKSGTLNPLDTAERGSKGKNRKAAKRRR